MIDTVPSNTNYTLLGTRNIGYFASLFTITLGVFIFYLYVNEKNTNTFFTVENNQAAIRITTRSHNFPYPSISTNITSTLPCTRAVVIVHWLENLDWIQIPLQLGYDIHVRSRDDDEYHKFKANYSSHPAFLQSIEAGYNLTGCKPRIRSTLEPNWGGEASGYLRYIIEAYDDLPEIIYFVHGDPFTHNTEFLQWLPCMNPYYRGFFNINMLYVRNRLLDGDYDLFRKPIMDTLAKEKLPYQFPTLLGKKFSMFCCAQFLIGKPMILSYSKRYYEILLEAVMNLRNPMDEANPRWGSTILEHAWEGIFGETIDIPNLRSHDDYCTANNASVIEKDINEDGSIPVINRINRTRVRPFINDCLGGPCAPGIDPLSLQVVYNDRRLVVLRGSPIGAPHRLQ